MMRSAAALLQVMRELKVPRSDLQPRVNERLRRTLISAYRYVPYYRDTMKSTGYDPAKDYSGPADLRKLPILTKQTIKDHGTSAFINENADLSRCCLDRTSGSTGQPLEIWRSQRSQALILARYFRVLMANGYRFTDKVLGFRPQKDAVIEEGGLFGKLGLLRWRKVDFAIPAPEMVEHLFSYEPDFLYGNLVHFELLAQELERQNLRYEKLKVILPGGEVIAERHRRRLAEVFKTRVAVTYGSAEMGIMAFDTPQKPGHQLCEDLIHYEFLDAEGEPIPAGQRSRIIMTDLTNPVMPLIR